MAANLEWGGYTSAKEVALRQEGSQLTLMTNMNKLMAKFPYSGKQVTHPPNAGKRIVKYLGPPELLLGQITNPRDLSKFIDATPAELGQLVPRMDFYYSDKDGDTQFIFGDYLSVKQLKKLAESKKSVDAKTVLGLGHMGMNVGVREFRWTWDNKHEGDRTIKASLTLYFGSVRELLVKDYLQFIFKDAYAATTSKKKSATTVVAARKAELAELKKRYNNMQGSPSQYIFGRRGSQFRVRAVPTAQRAVKGSSARRAAPRKGASSPIAEGFQQLKVILGWSTPQGQTKTNTTISPEFKSAVEATQRCISLNLIKYELNFEQEGQVELVIEYVGSLDSVYSDPRVSDVFSPSSGPHSSKVLNSSKYMLSPDINPADPTGYGALGHDIIKNDAKKYYVTDALGGKSSKAKLDGKDVKGFLFNLAKVKWNASTPMQSRFEISLDQLAYERETLVLHRKYNEKIVAAPKTPAAKQKRETRLAIERGLSAIDIAAAGARAKVRQERYSYFVKKLIQGKKMYYMTMTLPDIMDTLPDKLKPRSVSGEDATKIAEGMGKDFRAAAAGGEIVAISVSKKATSSQNQAMTQRMEAATAHAANSQQLSPEELEEEKKSIISALNPEYTSQLGQKVSTSLRGGTRKIYYFFLQDILQIAIENTYTDSVPGLKLPKVVLGTFMPSEVGIGLPGVSPTTQWNIGDIPISIEYFSQWILDEFVSKEVEKVSFRSFADKLMNGLVANLINETWAKSGAKEGKKISFDFTTDISEINFDKIASKPVLLKDLEKLIEEQGSGTVLAERAKNNYFFILSEHIDKSQRTGDLDKDRKARIPHLFLGNDRGLVKTFSFTEKKMPFIRAMHVEDNRPGAALVLPQDVELSMVGNCYFRNGNLIYINADFALGSAVARELGLGGYYRVVRSDNSIVNGKFETTLTCMFELSPS